MSTPAPIFVTKHAIERAKQRMNLTEPQITRLMTKIHQKGAPRWHMPKDLRQWFDRRIVSPEGRRESVTHDGHLFLVERGVLITIVALPVGLHRSAIAAAKANRASQKL
jgi:hypothetical protein